jgi:predicted acylesterase/phospholipase RssA
MSIDSGTSIASGTSIKNINITHLVLSGGGMRGVIFVGALRYLYLNNMHKNIKHIAGCSVGSLIGLMFALKLTIDEMEEVLYNCMKDNELCFLSIKRYIRLITELGLFDTQAMIKHLKIIIKRKYADRCKGAKGAKDTGCEEVAEDAKEDTEEQDEYNAGDISETITFAQLSKIFGVNMYISCTNINTCDNEIFSIDKTPDACAYKACCASMSIPLLFKPINIGDYYYYDGGLTNNFPIKIFADVPRENIMGMLLYKDNEKIQPVPAKTINFIYIVKQLMTILNMLRVKEVLLKQIQDSKYTNYYRPQNLVLSSGMNIVFARKGMRLHITKKEIDEMIYVGFETMTEYIDQLSAKYAADANARIDAIGLAN